MARRRRLPGRAAALTGCGRSCSPSVAPEQIEPPSAGRCDRIIRSALHQAEQALTARVTARLGPDASARLAALAAAADDDEADGGEPSALALIKSVPGNVSLESMLTEIGKLDAARAAGLPDGLFSGVAPRVVAAWRARAAVEAPSHLRDHPRPLMLTLLAALVHERQREITDTLADLLISTVHRIGARAERRVTQELVSEFRKVAGKETLLFRLAEAAIARPDDTVRAVVYPVAGEKTLRDLVAEYKSSGPAYRRTVQTTLRGLLHQALPARADPAARGARVPRRQQRLPAGDRGAGADPPPRRRGQPDLLPRRGARPCARRDHRGLEAAGLPHRPARPPARRPDGLRGRHLPGAARASALQGDLDHRSRPVAQP